MDPEFLGGPLDLDPEGPLDLDCPEGPLDLGFPEGPLDPEDPLQVD